MRKTVLFIVLALGLFLKTFDVQLESADLPDLKDKEMSHSNDPPVQGRPQTDLFEKFFLVGSPDFDYDCREKIERLKADAIVLITSSTTRIGDPFFIISAESNIIKGTLFKFFSSCDYGRIGLLRFKEKTDWPLRRSEGLAFAQKPSPDIVGSITRIDSKSARQYFSLIEPHMPKYYGDVSVGAYRVVPPGSHEEYLLIDTNYYETEGHKADDDASFAGFLFGQGAKGMDLLAYVPGLAHVYNITDIDRDGIYEVMVLARPEPANLDTQIQIRLFDGKTLSESKRVMVYFEPN